MKVKNEQRWNKLTHTRGPGTKVSQVDTNSLKRKFQNISTNKCQVYCSLRTVQFYHFEIGK